MCLYPQRMVNKKYTVTEKNGGCVPAMIDERCAYVQIPCGNCIECRKQKARNWQIRLNEEIRNCNYPYFITLTFAPDELKKLMRKECLKQCNALAARAVRRMLERWRKDHKKSIKHWLVTELGHEGTERIHLHGILFSDIPLEFTATNDSNMKIWKYWKYGHVYVGDYCSNRTVNYIVKYITKIDTDHKGFKSYVLCSPGMGKKWLERMRSTYKYIPGAALDYYRMPDGTKLKLPTYYKNHLYNEDQREEIWRDFMDQNKTAIMGNEYHDNWQGNKYGNIIHKAQEINRNLGYGDNSKEWQKLDYNITPRMTKTELPWQKYANLRKKMLKNLEISK